MSIKWLLPVFLILSFTYNPWVSALQNDAHQPVSIESNSGFYDDKKGVSVYAGEVIVIQGSMRMNADKVVVYMQNREIQKLVATGKPVKFKQTPEAGKEAIHGNALTAEYYPQTQLLIMLKDATVWQGKNSTTSARIEYDQINEIIKAESKQSINKRVHVILQPNAKGSQQ